MPARHKAKNVEGNLVGEGLVQGGIIVVGPDGKVVYTYLEKSGSPLPLEEIRTAILSFGGACKALPEPVKA